MPKILRLGILLSVLLSHVFLFQNCGSSFTLNSVGASGEQVASSLSDAGAGGSAIMADLRWSSAGPIQGLICTLIDEPSDPNGWDDNYLCGTKDWGLRWSHAGDIPGMVCTQILEPADIHTWSDNFLCTPEDQGLRFSSAGPIPGLPCLQITEPADPDTWNDNYLCGLNVTASAGKRLAASPVAGINWLSPLEPVGGFAGAADFLDLFKENTWPQAMSHINGILLYDYYIEQASDADLRQVFSFISAHGMQLGISFDAISPPAGCEGMIGTLASNQIESGLQIAAKIQRLGGNLNFIFLDEPFYWGHYVGTNNGVSCLFSADTLVANIAPSVHGVQAVFPNVRIGIEEPLVNYPIGSDWLSAYDRFLSQMTAAGMPIVVHHDDALLTKPAWTERIGTLQSLLANHGVAYGLIHNGTGALNDSQWSMNFQARIQTYNWAGLVAPAQHAFQTWEPFPSHNLPESSPTSLTGLVNFYFSSPYVSAPAPAALARLTAPNGNAWLLTTSQPEMASAESMGWSARSVVAYVYPSPASNSGLVAMERLFYAPLNDFLYTCSTTEAAYAVTLGYVDMGPAGYAFPVTDPRGNLLFNANNQGLHFYTSSGPEMGAFLASHPKAVQEGPRCATIPYIINGESF